MVGHARCLCTFAHCAYAEVAPGRSKHFQAARAHLERVVGPSWKAFGETLTVRCRATIVRAGPLGRLKAKLEGYGELTELFEVSFSPGRKS